MIQVLKKEEFQNEMVSLIGQLYTKTSAIIRKENVRTDSFVTCRGVIQGCLLLSHFFNIFLKALMRETIRDHKITIKIDGECITNLRYTDDNWWTRKKIQVRGNQTE